jgi:hypothetical protein
MRLRYSFGGKVKGFRAGSVRTESKPTNVITYWQNHGGPYLQGVKDPRGQLTYMSGASQGFGAASHPQGA